MPAQQASPGYIAGVRPLSLALTSVPGRPAPRCLTPRLRKPAWLRGAVSDTVVRARVAGPGFSLTPCRRRERGATLERMGSAESSATT